MILSQSDGLGKMSLEIVKIYLESPFSANFGIVRGQFVVVSCRGPTGTDVYIHT